MKICLSLVHLITIGLLLPRITVAQTELPQARIVNLNVDPEQVVVLHLRPGYVSSVRVLEEVSSVVLGDPGSFKAEHSDAEPQLVFGLTTPMLLTWATSGVSDCHVTRFVMSLVAGGCW